MDDEPNAGREAVMVWLKLLGLLVLVAAFGLVTFWLRRSSLTH